MKTLFISTALLMASIGAFSQQREMVQTQRAETSQQSSPAQYQQYTPPQQQTQRIEPAQQSQPAMQYTAPAPQYTASTREQQSSQTGKSEPLPQQTYAQRTNTAKHTDSHAKVDGKHQLPKTQNVDCADEHPEYIFTCPICGRTFASGGFCSFDGTPLVAEYVGNLKGTR